MRWRIARTGGVAVLVLVSAGLVGCDFVNNSSPYLAARAVNGAVEISICSDIRVSSVRLYGTSDGGDPTAEEQWWSASGDETLAAGTTLTTARVSELFSGHTSVSEPELTGFDDLNVSIVAQPKTETMVATFPTEKLLQGEDEWVAPDGSARGEPCEQ